MSELQRPDSLPLIVQRLQRELETLQRSVNFSNTAAVLPRKFSGEAELGEIYVDAESEKLSFKDLSGTIRLVNTTP